MKTLSLQSTLRVGARDLSSSATYEAEGLIDLNTELPAGTDAEIATKTDADTATVTLPEGHGLTDGNFDVYWTGGVRYGVPGTIVTNTLSLDGGAGDDFPAAETAVVVSVPVEIVADFQGDLLVALAAHSDRRAHLDFQSSGSASLLALEVTASKLWVWADDQGFTNPLAGDTVAKILASCGESAGVADLSVPILYDAVS